MFYKTDLGGFVRSGLYEISEFGFKDDGGLLTLFYKSEPNSGLSIFHYNSKSQQLVQSTFKVTDLYMECEPDDDLVRMLPTTHTSFFLTLPKQDAIINQTSGLSNPFADNPIIYIDHSIKWNNPVNLYGWITWAIVGTVVLGLLSCLIKNIVGYKKDKELLKDITSHMQETEYHKSENSRNTNMRPTDFKDDDYVDFNTLEEPE